MAKTLASSINFRLSARAVDTQDLSNKENNASYKKAINFATGLGLNQADRIFMDQRTLAASGTEDLDVATGGGLFDVLGDALAFVKLKALIVHALPANTHNVNVTRPAANGVTIFTAVSSGVALSPGGLYVLVRPDLTAIPVTPTTADLITFTNSGAVTPVTFDVFMIGTSA
jgi:hypothetical protein